MCPRFDHQTILAGFKQSIKDHLITAATVFFSDENTKLVLCFNNLSFSDTNEPDLLDPDLEEEDVCLIGGYVNASRYAVQLEAAISQFEGDQGYLEIKMTNYLEFSLLLKP